jgi:hypothetical protein
MNEWLSIIAVIVSPLVAVLVSMWIEQYKQHRRDKMELFQILMTQRGIIESYAWVNALNSIYVVFSDEQNVLRALDEFLAITNVKKLEDMDVVSYENKKVKLLEAMSKSLGYSRNINWEQIKAPYVPNWILQEKNFNMIMKQAQLKTAGDILNTNCDNGLVR